VEEESCKPDAFVVEYVVSICFVLRGEECERGREGNGGREGGRESRYLRDIFVYIEREGGKGGGGRGPADREREIGGASDLLCTHVQAPG